MTAVDRTGVDGYDDLILQGLAIHAAGRAARRVDILTLHAQGLQAPAISRELQRRAREAGRSDEDIARLGISDHNVRIVLRAEVAGGG